MYTQLNQIEKFCDNHVEKEFIKKLILEIIDEFDNLKDNLKDADRELTELQAEREEERLPELAYLGLDTLHYRLENNNLKIQDQLDTWIEMIKKQNGVGASYAR